MAKSTFTHLVWLQSFGQSRSAEIKFALTKEPLRNPIDIVMHACSFMSYWAGVCNSLSHGTLLKGINIMMSVACGILTQQSTQRGHAVPTPANV